MPAPANPPNVGQRRRTQLAQAMRQQESVTLQRGTISAQPTGDGTLSVIMNGGSASVIVPCYRHVFATAVNVGDTVDVLVSNNGMRVIGITGRGPVPSGRLFSTAQTVLPSGTSGTVSGLVIDFVEGGMIGFGGSALQVPTNGRYQVDISVYWQASGLPIPGGLYAIWLAVNGTQRRNWNDSHPPGVNDYHGVSASDVFTLDANDYLQIVAQQNSGANAGTTFSPAGNPCSIAAFLVATL